MAELHSMKHGVPTDLEQIPIVWRYELQKHLRSKRLVASFGITFAVLALIYILPIALGESYSGTEENVVLQVIDPGYYGIPHGALPYSGVAILGTSGIDVDSLVLYINGTEYPSGPDTWSVTKGNELLGVELPGAAAFVLFSENATEYQGAIVTASYDWVLPAQDFGTLFLGFANILIIICATLFAADALVGEFQNRTGYLIFPNPLKRETLFIGKYLASVTAGLLIVAVFYLGVIALSAISVGAVDDDFGLSFAFAAEFLLAAMAVAYLVSAVMKGTTGATVLTFFLLFMILPIVDGVSAVANVKIEASLTFAANAMVYVLVDPYPTDTTTDFGGGMSFSAFYPEPSTAAIVMLVYFIVAMVISLFLFKRKQLVG